MQMQYVVSLFSDKKHGQRLAVGEQHFVRPVSRRTSVRIRLGSPFSSKVVVYIHCLVTLFLTINETLNWFSTLPTLMQESFW